MQTAVVALFATVLSGPTIGAQKPDKDTVYVEFDFSTLPSDVCGKFSMTLTVLTADKDLKYSEPIQQQGMLNPQALCEGLADNMRRNRFKVEIVDKTKLRVYGRNFNDKLIPATKGKVESPDLKKEELPKVKNPDDMG